MKSLSENGKQTCLATRILWIDKCAMYSLLQVKIAISDDEFQSKTHFRSLRELFQPGKRLCQIQRPMV
ncbi:unnamed protein product [Brugia timori]|nr:unnamed protein product [Brugia timori]